MTDTPTTTTTDTPVSPTGVTAHPLGGAFAVDAGKVQSHLDRVVRETVEQTLNALLDAEADALLAVQRCIRSHIYAAVSCGTWRPGRSASGGTG
jgi:hypothetical protein